MITGTGRLRSALLLLAGLQVLWHAVTSLLPGGGLSSCFAGVGRLALSGVQLAWWSLPGSCADTAALDARQVALTAVLTAVPALLTDAALMTGGAVVVAWATRIVRTARRAMGVAVRVLPELPTVPVRRRLSVPVEGWRTHWFAALLVRGAPRRGPPVVLAAA